jgi:hypothetical protein
MAPSRESWQGLSYHSVSKLECFSFHCHIRGHKEPNRTGHGWKGVPGGLGGPEGNLEVYSGQEQAGNPDL